MAKRGRAAIDAFAGDRVREDAAALGVELRGVTLRFRGRGTVISAEKMDVYFRPSAGKPTRISVDIVRPTIEMHGRACELGAGARGFLARADRAREDAPFTLTLTDGLVIAHGFTAPGSETSVRFERSTYSFGASHGEPSMTDCELAGPSGAPQALARDPLALFCD